MYLYPNDPVTPLRDAVKRVEEELSIEDGKAWLRRKIGDLEIRWARMVPEEGYDGRSKGFRYDTLSPAAAVMEVGGEIVDWENGTVLFHDRHRDRVCRVIVATDHLNHAMEKERNKGPVTPVAQTINPEENLSKRQQKKDAERDAKLRNKIKSVLAGARTKWPNEAERPSPEKMAEHLASSGKYGYSYETMRKILRGEYRAMIRLDINGL